MAASLLCSPTRQPVCESRRVIDPWSEAAGGRQALPRAAAPWHFVFWGVRRGLSFPGVTPPPGGDRLWIDEETAVVLRVAADLEKPPKPRARWYRHGKRLCS